MMLRTIVLVAGLALAATGSPLEAGSNPEQGSINERTLFIRSVPGYPGVVSDVHEVYMEPYLFKTGLRAVADVRALDAEGNQIEGVRGRIELEQFANGVRVSGTLMGLPPGTHGFHVHEKGDLSKGCMSAAAHFNPYQVHHGAPSDAVRHTGDLGNIQAGEDGTAQIDIFDAYLSLVGARGVVGRAIVVHEKPDDYGRGGTEDSLKTGSAGARLGCGIIGFG